MTCVGLDDFCPNVQAREIRPAQHTRQLANAFSIELGQRGHAVVW